SGILLSSFMNRKAPSFMAAATALSFYFISPVMDFLQRPLSGLEVSLNYFKPYEKFMTYMKVAFFSGLIFTMPFMLAQAGAFIYPALKKSERPVFWVFTVSIPSIMLAGFAFGYFVMVPVAFKFFAGFAQADGVRPVWGISSYFDVISSVIFWCGMIFQLPLILVFLMKLGIIKAGDLEKARKVIVVVILTVAAVFTPPDVVTQVLMAVPLYLLFELSIIIGKRL
ncbi:MAG TPA: twin-arginine translocase subunit TatC, partial [Candidatus Goldiibacteriota bacterium]|nr:twin-arginine translocase subunit TatC [Candidatus Goldiibacteriota bacterium]